MHNRWGVEIRKGLWASAKLPRGGHANGVIEKIDRRSSMAKAYGTQVTIGPYSVNADDISVTSKPTPEQLAWYREQFKKNPRKRSKSISAMRRRQSRKQHKAAHVAALIHRRSELARKLEATPTNVDASSIIRELGDLNVAIADAQRAKSNPAKRRGSKLSDVDFNQKAYRGYLIRKNSLTGDMWIEKDGHLIGRVPASQSWAWAQKEIDALLDPTPNPKRRTRTILGIDARRAARIMRKSARELTRIGRTADARTIAKKARRLKNPVRYKITAQNTGKKMHFDGRHFSERPTVKSFALAEDAKQTALALIRRYPILRKYRVRVESFP